MIIQNIPKNKIKPNPNQRRKDFGDLEAFAQDIKKRGLLNPITVRPDLEKEGYYILVAGDRRLHAFPYAEIPCHIMEDYDKSNTVAENLVRRELNSIEIAYAFSDLIESNYTITDIAALIDPRLNSIAHAEKVKGGHRGGAKLKTKEQWVKDHLNLITLPKEMQALMQEFRLAHLIVAEELTTAELRQFIAMSAVLADRGKSLKSYKEHMEGRDSGEEEAREKFTEMFGFVPDSSWYSKSNDNAPMKKFVADTYSLFKIEKGRGYEGSYTEFLPDVAYRILSLWSDVNDVVVDPMAGRGTRGALAWAFDRNVWMFDCDPRFSKQLKKLVSKANKFVNIDYGIAKTNYIHHSLCDSRHMPARDNSADLVFSCPPYWVKELYKGQGQLTDLKDYREFLQGLSEIFADCYRILKPNKYMVMVVADFREGGKLYNFSGDTISCATQVGFNLWDIVISKVTTNKQVRIQQCLDHKFTIKDHEYILVFKK
jgi:DNA modification methylase